MTTTEATTTETETTESRGSRLRSRLPPWARSARTRLAVSVLALLGAALLVSVLALREVLIARTADRVDSMLEQEVSEFRRLAGQGRDPRTGRPFGRDIRGVFEVFLSRNVPSAGEAFFTFAGGRPFQTSSPEPPDRELLREVRDLGSLGGSARGEISADSSQVRYLAVPVTIGGVRRGVFAVTVDEASERAEVDDAVQVAAGISILVFLAGAAVVFVSVGRILAPVRVLTETARSITETDITRRIEIHGDDELAEAARTFNAMLDRLESAFSSQRHFLSDAGHELRTPITIVRGQLEVMGDDPGERHETIELVTDELDRMARLVDDLLLLARSERPDFLRRETVRVGDLAAELHAKAESIAPRDWRLESTGEGSIHADPQRLTQAMINLAQNAAEHTSDGDEITIGSELRGGEARLWVRDTGPGIDPDDQARLFARFQRGDRAARGEGTGLGLALVKAIAEGHGGRVELSSAAGAGATFTIAIPVRAGKP